MLAPPITLFFSPASSSTITATTTTEIARKGLHSGHLTLKPVLSASVRSSMSQKKRPLSKTTDTKRTTTKTNDSKADRVSSTKNHIQPPIKRQKLDPDANRRVKLPLRSNNNNTLVRSSVDGSLELAGAARQKDRTAVQPPSDGTLREESDLNNIKSKSVKKLRLELGGITEGSQAGDVTEREALATERKSKDDSKRSLRSHDGGSRSKSELAQYFPNFDEIINPEARDKDFLTPKTRLFITDEPPKASGSSQFVLPTPTRTRASSFTLHSPQQQSRPPPQLDLTFEKIDLPTSTQPNEDPLSDAFYEVAHRRAERQEKQLRNIERERAQHEKVQLERLQEGLLGPDWLKIMGISGVTEGDRKKWDDARDYFLKEVKCLLDKFARWKEEERRRKMVEVRKRREAEEDEEEDEEEGEEEEGEVLTESSPDAAAYQLQLESLSASAGGKDKASRNRKPSKRALENNSPPATPSKRRLKMSTAIVLPDIPTGPFTSFFAKPHQRRAALDRERRIARTTWAFGHPVPDMLEKPFTLPRAMISEEGRKASARLRRGMRRGRE